MKIGVGVKQYETVIGLEVHLQLSTQTKAFCGCKNEFGLLPNSSACPVCLGFPGSLPVLNRQYLEYAIKVAVALNCTIKQRMRFDRKNYFYPDLPKNYQISQYDMPLSTSGYLDIIKEDGFPNAELQRSLSFPKEVFLKENLRDTEVALQRKTAFGAGSRRISAKESSFGTVKRIGIKRVHMEEDAGKLIHQQEDASFVDFNRCGTPLLEIVSEPDINSPDEAYLYLTTLKSLLEYLEVSDCDMEKGSLRCDANVSIMPQGSEELGVKIELKNMNSFKGVKAALEYEQKRQKDLLESNKEIKQQTRLWDANKKMTASMRTKEEAHDYRYFPEPDLVPYCIDSAWVARIKEKMPELPSKKKSRIIKDYAISEYDASILVSDKAMSEYFERCVKLYPKPKIIANWLCSDILKYLNSKSLEFSKFKLPPQHLAEMLKMMDEGKISGKIAKDILIEMVESGKTAQGIVKEKSLSQISDEAELREVIKQVLGQNQQAVADYRQGKAPAMTFLIGQIMKATRGKANPGIANKLLKEEMGS